MRIAFVGSDEVTVLTAEVLIEEGHEVVIVDQDRERINQLAERLDCSFLHGDGANPDLLKEVDPKATDILLCLTDNDQTNILASLVGRSLEFKHVVTSIRSPAYQGICRELGLEHTIIPSRMLSRQLADLVHGTDTVELSTALKDEARLFTFTARDADAVRIEELELPSDARVICLYREDRFHLPESTTRLQANDEVVVLTHSRNLAALKKRWGSHSTAGNNHAEEE